MKLKIKNTEKDKTFIKSDFKKKAEDGRKIDGLMS
jgi:hypothetical protein